MVYIAEGIGNLMNKYPIFALGIAILFLGAFSRPLFQINLFWLTYVGIITMFIGLLVGMLRGGKK